VYFVQKCIQAEALYRALRTAIAVQIKLTVTTNTANTADICIIYNAELFYMHTVE